MRPVLLEREGLHTSASTVGRILTRARERGVLVEPQQDACEDAQMVLEPPSCRQKAQRLACRASWRSGPGGHRGPPAAPAGAAPACSRQAGQFEQECKVRGIRLFVLPPRSPKLNGRVERAQRTHRQEYYERRNVPRRS